jgi:hypothetical protein
MLVKKIKYQIELVQTFFCPKNKKMKLSDFNNWPLSKKEEHIKTFVSSRPFIVGALVFEYYTITVVYSLTGKLISADAEAHGQKEIIDARKLLKGRPVVPIDGNTFTEVKQEVQKKIFSATHRNN